MCVCVFARVVILAEDCYSYLTCRSAGSIAGLYNSFVPHESSAERITLVLLYDVLFVLGYLLVEHDINLDL